ncbi:MAG: SDR family oxidoreductase [Alphaproteobacteria bacterium]|nr:SDR family oxidoreductase [Alphaproteobacteria bacterium]
MDLRLAGKTALITGGSKGIGLACAESLAAEGCNVILVARSAETLAAARDALRGRFQVNVAIRPADLSKGEVARALCAEHPDIDILINNAGAIPGGDLLAVDEPTWRNAWDLKVFGFINMCRAYFERMKARGDGVILNIIGSAGEKPDFNYIAGTAGNAGLMAFTRALGARSLDFGVRVLAINPGPTATDRLIALMKRRAKAELGEEGRWQELTKALPRGRAATPQEIADMAAFLVSPRSAYTSATIVTIDGGVALRR